MEKTSQLASLNDDSVIPEESIDKADRRQEPK